jgi:hypothetical protein
LGYGGESAIDSVAKNDRQRNVAWGLTLGVSLTRRLGLLFRYVGIENLAEVGVDADTFVVGASYFW